MDRGFGARVKETVKEWATSLSTHGLPGIVRNERWFLKLMWLVFFLACNGVCAYLIAQSIFSYLDFEVYNKYKPVYPRQVSFPAVSVCNANQFQNNQSFAFVDGVLAKNGISDPTDVSLGTESYATQVSHLMNSYGFVQYITQINAMNPNVSDATRQSFGASLTGFVLACFYGINPCSASDFTWYYDFAYGNCFKYNADGSKKIFKPGYVNGLQLILLTKVDKNINSFAQSLGSHLFIHNQTIKPYSYEGLNVAVGTQTNIAVSIKYLSQMGLPYNNCYKDLVSADAYDSVLYRTIIESNQTYRQIDCFRLCFQQRVIETCSCYNTNQPKLGNAQPCTTFRQLGCTFSVYVDFYSKNINDECGELCPLECDKVAYSTTVSFSDFPSEMFGKLLLNSTAIKNSFPNETLDLATLKQNIQAVNIFFDELKYTVIDQSPSMTLIDLVASIGGTLGLFIGISFLGSIEFVEILLEIMCIGMDESARGYFKKRKVQPQKASKSGKNMSDLKIESLA